MLLNKKKNLQQSGGIYARWEMSDEGLIVCQKNGNNQKLTCNGSVTKKHFNASKFVR